jgi:hypothetical protein
MLDENDTLSVSWKHGLMPCFGFYPSCRDTRFALMIYRLAADDIHAFGVIF